jgi:hypothetical protein
MGFKIREKDSTDWIEPGEWFSRFAELGPKIELYKMKHGELQRVLISVPTSETVAAAISLGFSFDSFTRKTDLAGELDRLSMVSENDLIQVQYRWNEPKKLSQYVGKIKNSEIIPPSSYVGRVQSITVGESRTEIVFQGNQGSGIKFQNGNSSAPKIFRVPKGVPQGKAKPFKHEDYALISSDFEDKESWMRLLYQLDPRCISFGLKNRIQQTLDIQIQEDNLCPRLGVESLSLGVMARLDGLSEDTSAHFVNAYEQITKFPEPSDEKLETLAYFQYVILDGNKAIDSLISKNAIKDKTIIGLWEVGASALQDQALERFKQSAIFEWTQVQNFEEKLEWKAPVGTKIWGWG